MADTAVRPAAVALSHLRDDLESLARVAALAEHLYTDEAVWLDQQLADLAARASRTVEAAAIVHRIHRDGGCS